jgi:integrase
LICVASDVHLIDYYTSAFRPIQLVGRSPKTLESYACALAVWNQWPGRVPLHHIDRRVLARFAEWALAGRKASTVNQYVKRFMAILRFAEEEDDIGRVPKYRKLAESKNVPLALTADEFLAVIKVCGDQTGEVGGIPAALWWRSLLSVDWESGLRIMALLSVTTDDVLLDQNGFYCQAENQKDKEAGWFPLSPETMAMVREIHDPCHPLLWRFSRCASWLQKAFRRILDASGIYAPRGACMAFHRIRRSTASYMRLSGLDATARLGHSHPRLTDAYIDPRVYRPEKCQAITPAPRPR